MNLVNITFNGDDNMTFNILEDKTTPFVNVMEYGAKGNGIDDDTQAFKAVLEMAKYNGAVRMYIPNGIYRLTAELNIYSNTTIISSENTRIVRDHNGYMILNGFRTDNYSGYSGNRNIKIAGGIWDANGVKRPSKASTFHFGHGENIYINNVTIKDTANSHGIEFNACKNILVENSKFLGWVGSTDFFNEAIQLDLAKNNGSVTIPKNDDTPCLNVVIRHCYFGNSGTSGSNPWGRAIGSHASTIGKWHENIKIVENTFENLVQWAVRSYSWKDVHIVNNTVLNCGGGFSIDTPLLSKTADTVDTNGKQTNASQNCSGYIINNNKIGGGLNYGPAISVKGQSSGYIQNCTILGNIVTGTDSGSLGVIVRFADDVSIANNQFKQLGDTGISVSDKSIHVTVANNLIRGTEGNGITISTQSHYAEIIGNTLKEIGGNGIWVSDNLESVVISSNNIAGVNGNNETDKQHIRITSNIKRVTIIGNVCRNFSTTHKTSEALYTTSTVQNVTRSGNVFAGFSINDNSNSKIGGDVL
ncbi:hypothetical protein J6TS2_40330 [Heyndrickxia sporothermodurans]|nr:hypothetical protein J6TS2_40330 [Heyndrickxia sporothermodurans]